MKTILMILAVISVAACKGPPDNPETRSYVLPKEMHDCSVFKVDGNGPYLYVVRCPNSQTTTHYETGGKYKTQYNIVVIDGQEYRPVEK